MDRIFKILLSLVVALSVGSLSAQAQHTLGVSGGYGSSLARLYPKPEETPMVWGKASAGVSWRYYSGWRYVGCFGLDLEWMQRGFRFAPNASSLVEEKDWKYYSRDMNTIMLPVVWQPYFYLAKNHVRIFFDLGATFSYDFGSTYKNEYAKHEGKPNWEGTYEYKRVRDNRFGYGLFGGAGVAVLVKRFEISVGARYYFGFSDVVRDRNKYYDNQTDGVENPFIYSPMRSPMDNLTFRVGVAYRFSPEFDAWKPREQRKKSVEKFNYSGPNKK